MFAELPLIFLIANCKVAYWFVSVGVVADKTKPLLQLPPDVVKPLTLIDFVPVYACAVELPDILKV